MVADLLTKPLVPTRVLELLEFYGVRYNKSRPWKERKSNQKTVKAFHLPCVLRVILLSVLAVPAKGQGQDEPHAFCGS